MGMRACVECVLCVRVRVFYAKKSCIHIYISHNHFQDHMWQHKQEERELKRVEGDIIKNQRAVRHTLRDFGNGMYQLNFCQQSDMHCFREVEQTKSFKSAFCVFARIKRLRKGERERQRERKERGWGGGGGGEGEKEAGRKRERKR